MSTDSESHGSRNSATYSIRSLDDVPIRKSAVQIIRERSTDLIQPGSPRKKGVMQITKLILKDPPTSPKRKPTPMVIRSIQTYTSSAIITENGQILHDHKNARGQEEDPLVGTNREEGYKIVPLPQVTSGRLKEEFEAKKNERNQASCEFQDYLLESFNKENHPKAGIEISKATSVVSANSNQPSGSEKSKSDSSVTTGSSKSGSQNPTASSSTSSSASKSEQKSEEGKLVVMPEKVEEPAAKPPPIKRPQRPKTADSRKSLPEAKKEKEKSYDPQKAREFIREQQAKRKQEKKTSGPQLTEKELIKKRLDELKKSTQVLVSKNVQKARKRSLSASGTGSQKSGTGPVKAAAERSKSPPTKPLRKCSSTSSLKTAVVAPEVAKSDSGKSSATSRDSRRRSSLLKANLNEKMGIMRKPDEVALEEVMMSPLRIRTPPQQPKVPSPKFLEPTVNESIRSVHEKSVSALEEELKLEVPEVRLVPDTTVKSQVPQEPAPVEKKEFKPVPPWLKHTLLQPDPYPFIMAVRKKLEAIRSLNPNTTSRPDESIIPKKPEETTKRSKTTNSQKCLEYLDTLKSVPYVNKPPSEIEQNISSVSLQHSDSNTTSEISSIKSDFVLPLPPLSSTKFDTPQVAIRESHRPEMTGPISPLSVDRISNMKITANCSDLERSVNFNRGDHMPYADNIPDRVSFNNRHVQPDNLHQSQLSLNTSEKQRNFLQKPPAEKTTKELEYHKMLEAFNRSLTQVIEVNQQLYSALKKPADPVPSERIKIRDEMTQTTPVPSIAANASANSNYSEDFERSDDLKPPSIQPPPESTQSTPEKSSTSLTTTTSSSSTTAPQSSTSPEESPTGKNQSSGSHSQLLDSRSLSLSDSHNTIPPMPDEYLPSFEESLRQKQQQQLANQNRIESRGPSLTSIETQISDEVPAAESLRNTVGDDHSKSLESISMHVTEPSEALNDQSPKELTQEAEMEVLKAASSSSGADDSELEAFERRTDDGGNNDTTMGSDIMAAVFNRTDMELSIMSTTISETNLSYSSIGLYDQLIHSEKCRGDQLAAQARLKEKALLNRTKGQLAWLELQKQRYRERGMMEQISAIKKKQRAILMRLEKERADLNKLKKFTPDVSSRSTAVRSPMTPKSLEKLNSFSSHQSNQISLRKSSSGSGRSDQHNSSLVIGSPAAYNGDVTQSQQQRMVTRTTTTTISNGQMQLMTTTAAIRGMELEPSESLEDILQRREEELQKRRQHVQTLLEWHQKLDREEQEILDIERNLLRHNQRKISESQAADEKTLSRIRSIEASLKTLQQIPEAKSPGRDEEDVHASGSKLNRLWYRLTGIKEGRYEPERSYTLTKEKLERLYEDAKLRVLEGFRENRSMRKALLEQSMSGLNSSGSTGRDVSGISETKNASSELVQTSVESSEGNSFQTTVNSAEVVREPLESANKSVDVVEAETKTDELNEEKSSLIDVEEIISRVSDITDNINGFLSSTTNIDELLQHEEQEKQQQSASVEFHTIEEEQDSGSQPKMSTDTYTVSFDIPTIEENRMPLSAEDSQLMIEDISLPAMMNDDSLLNDDESMTESIVESTEKVTEEIPEHSSLEEASLSTSSATTPTTAEETETEGNEVVAERTPPRNSITSELEKRLIILNENLGELSESFERVSVSRSPEVPKTGRDPSPDSETATSPIVEEEYSTDMDFAVDEPSMEMKSFLDKAQALKSQESPPTTGDIAESHKIEIKIRNKNVNENFPHPSTVNGPSTSGISSFSYLTPPAHGPSTSTPTNVVPSRMPDIINEAEVLRRQQLQIEQEIKQLEQQVVFFREIPNKPPPPYIPPANGSPLALIFPSEDRINELIETRTKELYFDEPMDDNLRPDNVTNIYEKLILDMCKELFTDVRPPKADVSFRTIKHEKRPLAFYNPPDRLVCAQNFMKQKIKRILNEDILLQQQHQQQLNLHHCPMPFLMFAGSSAKRKRDQVDEILAQEMFDEEARWTDFDREEIEVKERIVEEVTKMLVADAVKDMEQAWKQKHGGESASGKDDSTLHDEKVEEAN